MPNRNAQFRERHLGAEFCADRVAHLRKFIEAGVCFTLVSMPGVGATIFLRYLSTTDIAHFFFIDSYHLAALDRQAFFELVLREIGGTVDPQRSIVEQICQQVGAILPKNKKLVLIFNRFDQLKHEFDRTFFGNIQQIQNAAPEKISIITTATKPLVAIAPDALVGPNIKLFSQHFFLQPFDQGDTERLLKISPVELVSDRRIIHQAIEQSGGHFQLLQLLLRSHHRTHPLNDPYVTLQLRELFECNSFSNRQQLKQLAKDKQPASIATELLDYGFVCKRKQAFELFSPLFADYIIVSRTTTQLPPREQQLFQLLRENQGKVVPKDEIFQTLWPDDDPHATDWALNAVIYRLRRQPTIVHGDYCIESYKKIGYRLFKK